VNALSEVPAPNRLLATAAAERPQEKLQRLGPQALGDAELLAMLLRSGTRGTDVMTLSAKLLSDAGSLAGLLAWKEPDFRRLRGIGRVKALQLVTVMELARRALGQQEGEAPMLREADQIFRHLRPVSAGLEVEKFWVLCLNRRHRLMKRVEMTSGTANATLAHPREVFRIAMREGAFAIACSHNHPSGDPTPSAADVQVTRLLREAAQTVDIPLVDHVIVGQAASDPAGRGYYSFREAGMV
jgi:DNA repair protein RadC